VFSLFVFSYLAVHLALFIVLVCIVLVLCVWILVSFCRQQGLKAVFDEAIRAVLSPPSLAKSGKKGGKKDSGCALF
jgi:preprotein translocase subunit SecG